LAACVPVLCDWHRGALVVGWWIHGRSGSHVAERLDQAVGSWCWVWPWGLRGAGTGS
jgi:hypothetical protein